jgi:hypothetical protein
LEAIVAITLRLLEGDLTILAALLLPGLLLSALAGLLSALARLLALLAGLLLPAAALLSTLAALLILLSALAALVLSALIGVVHILPFLPVIAPRSK